MRLGVRGGVTGSFPPPKSVLVSRAMRGLILMLLSAPLLAHAATVAVMPVEAPEHEADGARVLQALRAAVAESGQTDKGEIKLNVPEARLSFSCFEEDAGCMAQVGAILEAEQLIWARLAVDARGYTLKLNRLDVGTGQLIRSEAFEAPAGPEVVKELQAAARAFVMGAALPKRAPASAKTRVTFDSKPSGAEIWLDNALMGRTPATIDLVLGSYHLEFRHPDATGPLQQTLEVGAEPKAVRVNLDVAAGGGGGRNSTHLILGIGAGAVAVGGVVMAVVGKSSGDEAINNVRPGISAARYDELESQYNTGGLMNILGWSLAGAGAVASGYFIYKYVSDDGGAAIAPTGSGVSVIGRF